MSVYTDIRKTLEVYLSNTSSIPVVAWENVSFSPDTNTPFIKFQFQPTSRRPAHLGLNPQMRYQGIVTLLVHQPENQGPGDTEDLVDTLIDRFDATKDISYGGVIVSLEYAERERSYVNSPWYITPIRIGWYRYDS